MRNFLFWKFPKTAEAENGKLPKRESPGFFYFWEFIFVKENPWKFICMTDMWVHGVSHYAVDWVHILCTGGGV